ncbi:predicted protein [Nematostella vectensis]|uniref:PH domain-containing protein n=1 Tax=Nematostella vectensis TaxID=45351 RepID=A7RRG1_NEMVE|nr:predicted protein [Nematostella vectensis]|eukprot:XP_001638068.1 predicted protein [Nematostella vectensis]
MDPFTQKLLERTQARKEQLAMKRMELAACRTKRNAPSPNRQPLTENNTERNMPNEAESKHTKQTPAPNTLNTPIKKPQESLENSDSTTQNRHTEVREVKKRDRIQSDPSSPLTANQTRTAVDHTKKQRILSDSSVSGSISSRLKSEAEVESPSIQARRQMLLEMQKKDSEVTPKKHWKKAVNVTPAADTSSPSVAARSAAFLNQLAEDSTPIKRHVQVVSKTPVTPGRLAEAKNIFEKNKCTDSRGPEGKPQKINMAGPPKPPRLAKVPDSPASPSTKRRAPAPPVKLDDKSTKKPCKEEQNTESNAPQKNKEKVNDNKQRKRQSEEGIKGEAETESQNGQVRGREERKKARIEKSYEESDVVVAQPVVVESRRHRGEAVEATFQEAGFCKSSSSARVQRVPTFEQKEMPKKSTKVISIGDVSGAHKGNESQDACDAIMQALSSEEDIARLAPSKPLHTSSFKGGQDLGPFMLRSNCSLTHLKDADEQGVLDETVNLNDVNIHEMTFTFDFSNFDKIEEERETKFQKSFNEKCQELEKEKPSGKLSVECSTGTKTATREDVQGQKKPMVEKNDRGVYKSGYQSSADDKYATKLLAKAKPPRPERPKATHDKLKELLDEAASQQNIVLQMSQALNVCATSQDIFGGSQEEVEAERVLLLAAERKQACLNEHQRLKSRPHESMRGRTRPEIGQPCSASVTLSGIKLSLKQDFMDVLRVGIRQDVGVFHFVLHIQSGPMEITSSKTLSTNDCTEGNTLTFPDKFVLNDLDPKFALYIKVFGMNVQKPNLNAMTPNQKQRLKSKRRVDSPTPGAENLPVFRTPNFRLVGVARITLSSVNTKKLSLEYVPEGCPLNKHIYVNTRCMPQYKCLVKGFLTILEDIGGYSAWQRRWCVLEGGMLSYWLYPGDETTKAPLGSLDLSQCASSHVTTVSRVLCARPNTMELVINKGDNNSIKYLLAADTKADKVTWLDSLNEALKDYKAWSDCHKRVLYPDLAPVDQPPPRPKKPEREEVPEMNSSSGSPSVSLV